MPPMRHHEPTVSTVRRPSYTHSSSSSSSRRVSVTRLPLAPLSAQEMASNYPPPPPSAGPSSSSSSMMSPSKTRRRSSRQDDHRRSSLPSAPRLAKPLLTPAPDLPAFDPRVHDNLASYSFGAPPPPSTAGSEDTDDDDRSHRAKMRALDDGSRRPSLPINIPRRDSASSRRRPSRQIDDDGDDIMTGPGTDVPRSEPGLRAFRLRSQLVAQTAASGFDLNYILGTSSYPPSVASVHSRETEQYPIRDDSFARFVSKNDPEYTRRRALWSFRPERGSPPMSPIAREKSPEGSVPGDQHEAEIWACESVGRYCVWPNRQEITSGDGVATRRPVVIRHLTERREEERGPSVIIHKHSKVKAFSVFRGYHLPGTKIPASTAILIATKAVHISDTSHNGSNNFAHKSSRSRIEREARARAAAEESSAESRKRTRGHTVTNSGSSDRAASKAKATPPPNELLEPGHSPQPAPEVSPTEELPHMRKSHAVAFDSLDPSLVDHVLSRATPASIGEKLKRAFGNKPPGAVPSGGPIVPNQVEGNYVPPWMLMAPESLKHEEQRIIRNLNASFRAVGLIPPPKPRGSVSSESKMKRLSGSGGSSGNPLPSSLSKSPMLEEIPDDAMCMVLPLWPSSNGPSSPGDVDGPPVGYQTPLADRQYLLVYYVPIPENEPSPTPGSAPTPIDKGKAREMSPPPPPPPPSASKKRSRQQRASEAALSPDLPASSPGRRGTPTRRRRADPAKQAFKIIARMVTYAEVRECGLRLPRTGLSVTGVLSDALIGNPLYHASTPNFSTVIGVCHGRDAGIEFDPEGLDNLGLRRTPIGARLPPPQSAPLSVTLTGSGANLVVRAGSPTSIAPISSESLSVIGRAVLELTWSGCIALFEHGFP